MTISTTSVIVSAVGNGVTDTFPYTFPIFATSELLVYVDGVLQTITTDYTVTGVGTDTGGNVEFVTPPGDTLAVDIVATIALTQTTDLVNETRFFQDRIETRLDKLCRADQVAAYQAKRSLRIPAHEDTDMEIPAVATRANGYLKFDEDGNPLVANQVGSTVIHSSGTLNPGSLNALDPWATTVTVTGAKVGYPVYINGRGSGIGRPYIISAYCVADNQVDIYIVNPTAGTLAYTIYYNLTVFVP